MTKVDRVFIDYDPNDLMTYKAMDKGQIYYNVESHEYGIKLSPARFYSFRWECVYGFCDNKPNDSDIKHYLPIKDVRFVLYKCFWGGEMCINPHCNKCMVKEREMGRLKNNDKPGSN